MSSDPRRSARIFRKLNPDDDDGRRSAVPTAWVVGLLALLTLALPIAVVGSMLGDDRADADMAAVRVSDSDDDVASAGDDDDRDPTGRDASVRATKDGNTQRDGDNSITGNTKVGDTTERATKDGNTARNGDNSITGNTKIGDTTERATKDGNTARNGDNSITGNTGGADTSQARAAAPAPAAQGFAPAYVPTGGDSTGGASASG